MTEKPIKQHFHSELVIQKITDSQHNLCQEIVLEETATENEM